jgi:multiple sugar transport system permease protein
MYMKFSSSKGHIGASSSVGVLVFIMTTICALGIFYVLRDRDAVRETESKRKRRAKNQSEVMA